MREQQIADSNYILNARNRLFCFLFFFFHLLILFEIKDIYIKLRKFIEIECDKIRKCEYHFEK